MNTQIISPVITSSIRFSLSRLDILRCRLWVFAHNKILLTINVLASMSLPITSLLTSDSKKLSFGFVVFSFVFMTLFMLCFLAVIQIALQIIWLLLNKSRGVLGAHELEIRNDGLVEKTAVNESLHRWSGFHKISSSSRYFFIFVTDNNVIYVPKRCFSSPEDAATYHNQIQTHWRKALAL